ncbi:MAG TPA: NAD-dependent epimerase/dehydratase family protein [Terriglobales bacterium]|nr:NAD-dependent epimerase/dehydratase family protein [Terriglobales bacterium]
MKIFITGASGFIGINLVRRLAKTEHKLYCLVRKTSQVTELNEFGVTLAYGDVTDKNSLLQGMRGCDWVANLANVYSFWEPDNRVYKKVNVDGTRNVMESALETGVSKVLHVSTAGIFGKPKDSPFTEESLVGAVRFSEYSRTKYEGDLIAWEFYQKKGLPLLMVYPGAVLGPCDPKATGKYIKDLINRRLPARVLEDSVMTWVHVKDVAEIILRALENGGNVGEKYLAGNERLSFGQINQMVSEISGVGLPKFRLPDFMVRLNAFILTGIAIVVKRPPLWGMSTDQIGIMKEGFSFDGSKAERELGITYTPVRQALKEMIESCHDRSAD